MLTYVLEGDLSRVRIPPAQHPRFAHGLWRHTCCEAFIAGKGEPSYYEYNVSPSGEWALYAFAGERQRKPLPETAAIDDLNPHVTVCARGDTQLELDAVIRLDRLALTQPRLVLGLAAVIEADDGALSYWALRHPLAKPDFHHPDAFALELDEVRH